ncbi:hypothetical protein KUV46_01960 [Thalassovita mediterranea]|nr:hypothetical protein KUV46_01960 [Thalassovita mediterranea]
MLEKHRGLYVAALIFVAAGQLAQAQERLDQSEQLADDEQAAAEQPKVPVPVIILESEEAVESRQRAQEESAQREKADLAAQQGMNLATEKMADYALFQTALVLVGTIALLWTLLLTRQANRAARDAVSVTREMGEAQTRAYLDFRFLSATYLRGRNGGDGLRISGILHVVGHSPAKYVRSGLWVGDQMHQGEEPPLGMELQQFGTYVAPASVMNDVSVQVPFNTVNFNVGSANQVWCCIFVQWEDIFNKTQTAKYQFALIDTSTGTHLTGAQLQLGCQNNTVGTSSS